MHEARVAVLPGCRAHLEPRDVVLLLGLRSELRASDVVHEAQWCAIVRLHQRTVDERGLAAQLRIRGKKRALRSVSLCI